MTPRSAQITICYTVEPLRTDTLRNGQKCPSYRGVRLIEVIFNRNRPLGHLKVSVLERCPSYGMSVLRGFTVLLLLLLDHLKCFSGGKIQTFSGSLLIVDVDLWEVPFQKICLQKPLTTFP